MKKLNNLKAGLVGLSFMLWVITSIFNPIITLFKEPTLFEFIIGFNTFIVVTFLVTSLIPKAIKNKKVELSSLDLKTGSTKNKKEDCKSCKRKKRF